jgi:hypothetical protein
MENEKTMRASRKYSRNNQGEKRVEGRILFSYVLYLRLLFLIRISSISSFATLD